MAALKLRGVAVDIKTDFTAREVDYFRNVCNFTDAEREVYDLRVRGKSVVEISMQLNMSVSTVNRLIKAVKRKIVRVI